MAPPSQSATCRTARVTNLSGAFTPTKTMIPFVINQIPVFDEITDLTVGGLKQNRRIAALVDMRGWRYDITVKNIGPEPLYFNFAIVMNKTNGDAFSVDGFFREYSDSRDVSFSAAVTAQGMNRLPISPDNNVVLLKRQVLVPRGPAADILDSYNYGAMSNELNVRRIHGYVPFKKMISFNDDTTPTVDRKIWGIWWLAEPIEATTGDAVPNHAIVAADIIAFWNDGLGR